MDIAPAAVPGNVAQRWQERTSIPLSDVATSQEENDNIDILIGADYIHQFLKEKLEQDGEVAYKSAFGLVLSGQEESLLRRNQHPETQQWSRMSKALWLT